VKLFDARAELAKIEKQGHPPASSASFASFSPHTPPKEAEEAKEAAPTAKSRKKLIRAIRSKHPTSGTAKPPAAGRKHGPARLSRSMTGAS